MNLGQKTVMSVNRFVEQLVMKKLFIPSQFYKSSYRFAILPFLTVLLGKFLFENLAFDFPQLSVQISHYISAKAVTTSSSLLMLQELKARLLWTSSIFVYFFVNGCFFIFLWHTFKQTVHSKKYLIFFIAALFSSLEIIYLLSIDASNSPLHTIFLFTYDALSASKSYTPEQLTFIFYTLSFVNFIAIIVIPFSVLTGCSIVLQKATDFKQLDKQFVLLKDFVNGSSAIMVAGIIHMQLWLNWPLSFINDFPHINELNVFISTLIQYWGICYSLTIAALYLPIAAYLRSNEEVLYGSIPASKKSETLQYEQASNALVHSTSHKIPQIIAILGPMIIGSFSPMVSGIFTI